MTVGAFKSPIKEETRKLCDSKLAPNPRRARMFMAEKGIECDTVQVDITQGENLSDDFLAINPRGVLPTLVLDDGTVLDESVAICRYLEESQPQAPLKFPKRSASTLCH